MVIVAAFVGCGSGDLRSEPTAPTVVFADEVPSDQEIVWTDLEQVFSTRPATLPSALAELRPGLDGGRALAVLEAAHQPGVRIFTDEVNGTLALSSTLVETTNVGVTLVLADGKTLDAVDISLPDEVAIPMLTTRWGPPTETEFRDGGKAVYRWTVADEPWTATLYSEPGGKAIVKFQGRGPS